MPRHNGTMASPSLILGEVYIANYGVYAARLQRNILLSFRDRFLQDTRVKIRGVLGL